MDTILDAIRNLFPSATYSFRRGKAQEATPSGELQQVQPTPQPTQQPGIMEMAKQFLNSSSTTSSRWKEPTNELIQVKDDGVPQTVPQATPRPVQPNDPAFRFAYETMPRDQTWAEKGPRPGFQPAQPPADIGQVIRDVFPNEATMAALLASTENGQFDPRRKDNVNANGQGRDRGIFQINENSFNGLMERQAEKLAQMGINSYEDMYDPKMNAQVAKLIKEGSKSYNQSLGKDTSGVGGWYGWQDTGYDLNKGWFSKNDRIAYEQGKKKK